MPLTWPYKKLQALAWLQLDLSAKQATVNDQMALLPYMMLVRESTRGEPYTIDSIPEVDSLAQRIINNATAFETIVGTLSGSHTGFSTALLQLQSLESVNSFAFSYPDLITPYM